jgi:hypothetical protein
VKDVTGEQTVRFGKLSSPGFVAREVNCNPRRPINFTVITQRQSSPAASNHSMESSPASSKTAIFVFPSAAGHVNPSLPLARGLVAKGWAVDYLANAQFKEGIESTGATFFDRDGICRDHGIQDVTAAVMATAVEYSDPPPQWWLNFGSISSARLLPIYVDWFCSRNAQLVVYCPVLCQVARFAAMQLHLPAVSLLTTAGPGYLDAAIASMAGAAAVRDVAAGLAAAVKSNEANVKAIGSLRSQLAMPALTLNTIEPLCCDYYAEMNLVSTTEELADPMCSADAESYRSVGKAFYFVGPLLDVVGAKRSQPGQAGEGQQREVMRRVEAAAAGNRPVVYVSMGTVLTSDHAEHGWNATSGSGITGQQLCQSVCRAVFEELGEKEGSTEEDAPLIVVSLGPQPGALSGVAVPRNAVCAAAVPQVDLLRAGKPALFVTNGGQNSLMESMTVGTPVLVCPGFGDQLANAAKVVARGWGAKVDRPPADETAADASAYQAMVRRGVREVLDGEEFTKQAQLIAQGLERAEGINGALRILVEAARQQK